MSTGTYSRRPVGHLHEGQRQAQHQRDLHQREEEAGQADEITSPSLRASGGPRHYPLSMPHRANLPTIVLVGMMGSGKTTVGRDLAARTGWRYMDNDELVRAVTGRAPEEIDAVDGDDALHAAEASALRYALTVPPPLIAGAAAWVVTRSGFRGVVAGRADRGLPAGPTADAAGAHRSWAGPPRRRHRPGLAAIRAAGRDQAYRELATLVIDTDDLEVDEIAARILDMLEAELT